MVEHEGGEHSIEGRLGIWQIIRRALIELDRYFCSLRLSLGTGQRLRIGIESGNCDIRMKPLDQDCQSTGTTADVEDAMSVPEGCLIEEYPPCSIGAKQLYERIVERQGPIVAGSGKVGFINAFHFPCKKTAMSSRKPWVTFDP